MRNQKQIQLAQLDQKIKPFRGTQKVMPPKDGWIKTIRTTLNMTLEQLGKRLNITKQSVRKIEARELAGTVSLKALDEIGKAMEMKFVYGFVPKDGTVKNLIDVKAHQLATEIVMRTHQNMLLENQANTVTRIKHAIEELAEELRREVNRSIWD